MVKENFKLKKLILMSMLAALHVVFVRFLSFDTGIVRISFGFVPVSVAGMMLGPLGGGLTAVLADVLGMLINSKGGVYFFPFTVSEFLYGFGYGVFLYRKQPSMLKLSISIIIQFIVINLFLTSYWLYLYSLFITGTAKTFYAIFTSRLAAALVLLPVQVIVIDLLQKYLAPQLGRMRI